MASPVSPPAIRAAATHLCLSQRWPFGFRPTGLKKDQRARIHKPPGSWQDSLFIRALTFDSGSTEVSAESPTALESQPWSWGLFFESIAWISLVGLRHAGGARGNHERRAGRADWKRVMCADNRRDFTNKWNKTFWQGHKAAEAMLCSNRMGLYSGSERKQKKKVVINTPFKYKTNKK